MWTSALFGVNIIRFFEIYGASAQTMRERGLSQCGQGGRESQFFAIWCGRPLWTTLKGHKSACSQLHAVAGSGDRYFY